MDPISLGLREVNALFLLNPMYLTGSLLALISLFSRVLIKKYWAIIFIVLILILIFFERFNSMIFESVIISIHLSILMIFIQRFILHYNEKRHIKLFLLILIFYELTVILKVLNLMLGLADAVAFFYITSIAQSLFGLYFSINREN
jgi:hypothetical protein